MRNNLFVNSELKRIDYLDGWRGLAIISLLVGHFLPIPFINMGALGVDLFFVLSGLLMSKILFEKRVSIKTFYKRRISRILPAFFIFVTTIYAFDVLFLHTDERGNFFYTIFFLRTYLPTEGTNIWDASLPIGHVWSLNVEEHCYILLATLASLPFLYRKEWMIVLFIALLAILMQVVYFKIPNPPMNYEIHTETASSHLLLSCAYYQFKERLTPYVLWWMPLIALILGILCFTQFAPWYASWLFSPFFLAFSVNHLSVLPKPFIKAISWRPLTLMGIWSYSIYLWQQPWFYPYFDHDKSITFDNLVFLAGAIITGIFSFYALENPVRKFLNERW